MDTKIALVTGASSGIGLATAHQLHARGFTVYGTSRSLPSGPAEQPFPTLCMDLHDDVSMTRAVDHVLDAHGRVDVLVNNAGWCLNGFLEDLPLDEVRRQLETNVIGLLRMSQLVAPAMRERSEGRIINVSSVGGVITAPGAGAYHASKFAVEAITDVLRMELHPFGVHVSLVRPPGVATPFIAKTLDTYPGTGPDSAYADLLSTHRRNVEALADRGVTALTIAPERVARAIAKQATTRRPRTRVHVGPAARAMIGLRRALPDRTWDRMITAQMA